MYRQNLSCTLTHPTNAKDASRAAMSPITVTCWSALAAAVARITAPSMPTPVPASSPARDKEGCGARQAVRERVEGTAGWCKQVILQLRTCRLHDLGVKHEGPPTV